MYAPRSLIIFLITISSKSKAKSWTFLWWKVFSHIVKYTNNVIAWILRLLILYFIILIYDMRVDGHWIVYQVYLEKFIHDFFKLNFIKWMKFQIFFKIWYPCIVVKSSAFFKKEIIFQFIYCQGHLVNLLTAFCVSIKRVLMYDKFLTCIQTLKDNDMKHNDIGKE